MDKGLDASKINELLNKEKKQREQSNTSISAADDFYAVHAKELLDMLDGKRENVVIRGHTMYVANRDEELDSIYIRPTEGFVPCGWFSREWLRGKLAEKR